MIVAKQLKKQLRTKTRSNRSSSLKRRPRQLSGAAFLLQTTETQRCSVWASSDNLCHTDIAHPKSKRGTGKPTPLWEYHRLQRLRIVPDAPVACHFYARAFFKRRKPATPASPDIKRNPPAGRGTAATIVATAHVWTVSGPVACQKEWPETDAKKSD